MEAAQIWRESQQKNRQLYWLRFGGNWLHIILWRIVLEAAQIWRKKKEKKMTTVLYTKYMLIHNWKKGSSSPREMSVFVSLSVCLSARL